MVALSGSPGAAFGTVAGAAAPCAVPMVPAAGTRRIAALDGLRGLLAMVVLAYHIRLCSGTNSYWMGHAATGAVMGFFTLSGLVLSRGYDGRYGAFLVRRAVRLWPVYAACIVAGTLVQHRALSWPVLFGFAGFGVHPGMAALQADPPAWSLCVEALAMPFMPLLAWFARGSLWRAAMIPPFWLAALTVPGPLVWLGFFMAGAALSRYELRSRRLESRLPQYLGRISYSLYLSHIPVLMALLVITGSPYGLLAGVPAVFVTAWLLWRFVEEPSIRWSRFAAEASSSFLKKKTKKLLTLGIRGPAGAYLK